MRKRKLRRVLIAPIPRFRPILLRRHRVEAVSDLFNLLSRSIRLGLPMTDTLSSIRDSSLMENRAVRLVLSVLLGMLALAILVAANMIGSEIGELLGMLLLLPLIFVARMHSNDHLGLLAERLRKSVEAGRTLSEAMEASKGWFEPHEIEMVRAGEQSGRLDIALRNLSRLGLVGATNLFKRNLLVYPAVLGLIYTAMGAFLILFILPKYAAIYDQMGMSLPWLTRAILGSYDLIANFWLLALPALFLIILLPFLYMVLVFPFSGSRIGSMLLFVVFLLYIYGTLSDFFKRGVNLLRYLHLDGSQLVMTLIWMGLSIVLAIAIFRIVRFIYQRGFDWLARVADAIPGVRRLVRGVQFARFFSALGAMLEGAMPMHEAVAAAGRCSGSRRVGDMAQRVRARIEQGRMLSEALEEESYLPERTRRMVRLAELNETLPEQSVRLADWLYEDAIRTSQRLGSVFEPLCVVLIGVLALALLAAIYLPIFSITKGIAFSPD